MEIKKDNSGLIFKNTKKTAENHPDYKGQIKVDGKVKDIGLWVRKDKNGSHYFGAALTEPQTNQTQSKVNDIEKDDLPF
jgi:uncharacterized protein (DUF736 family)